MRSRTSISSSSWPRSAKVKAKKNITNNKTIDFLSIHYFVFVCLLLFKATDGKFQFVSKAVLDEAEKYAKESMESDDEEM